MDGTQLLATVDDATEALRLSRSKVYELMKAGEIRYVEIGASRRIPVEALREFVERLSERDAV